MMNNIIKIIKKNIKKLFKVYNCLFCKKEVYRIFLKEEEIVDSKSNYFICKKCLPLARED